MGYHMDQQDLADLFRRFKDLVDKKRSRHRQRPAGPDR
jgi:hypothetical protein